MFKYMFQFAVFHIHSQNKSILSICIEKSIATYTHTPRDNYLGQNLFANQATSDFKDSLFPMSYFFFLLISPAMPIEGMASNFPHSIKLGKQNKYEFP